MQLFSQNHKDLIPLAELLGTHFQIRDDYINLKQENVNSLFFLFFSSLKSCLSSIWIIRDFVKI
jgi:hypothetical protein